VDFYGLVNFGGNVKYFIFFIEIPKDSRVPLVRRVGRPVHLISYLPIGFALEGDR
jgi:hypothetical protein